MKQRLPSLLLAAVAACPPLLAQGPPANGPRALESRWHALVHATLVPAPGEEVADATIVLRDGKIVAVDAGTAPPAGARVWDYRGRHVYAGWIEPYLTVAVPEPDRESPSTHWNPKVTAERSATDGDGVDPATRTELQRLGFAAAAIAPDTGVFRGRGAVVLLDNAEPEVTGGRGQVVREDCYHTLSLSRAGSGYPRSLMGCVALIRQTLLDAAQLAHNRAVYARDPQGTESPAITAALVTLDPANRDGAPLLFDVGNELEALTAMRIAAEFTRPSLIAGSGTEYRRLAALTAARARLILPLAFPEPPDVSSEAAAAAVSLRDLMAWEQAPTNPRRVVGAGLSAALTTHRLKERSDFGINLGRALKHGLSEDQALAMLTTAPAEMLGVADVLGTVAAGRIANLIVTDGPVFAADTKLLDLWVGGRRHVIHSTDELPLLGDWHITSGPFTGTLEIRPGKKVALRAGDDTVAARKVAVAPFALDFLLDDDNGVQRIHASVAGDRLMGRGVGADGAAFSWAATRDADAEPAEPATETSPVTDVPEDLPTPFGAFGRLAPPQSGDLIISGATLWGVPTTEKLENGVLYLRDGKIAYIGTVEGTDIPAGVEVIDARGKHITAGLIDCHSHTGIRGGTNEGTQAVTSEVRVQDSLDPDDINWYRQLAGGVTAVQQLHGSANPIGGQSSVVKLRWGVADPTEMFVRGATPGIKFALGENVKRSRSPDSTRYPRTRMGVEALMRDRFLAARDYARAWQVYRSLPADQQLRTIQPRRDLELEALVDVLAGLRLIHCHSYRQDEILMMCRLAEEFDFQIGTFQHGFECYKVAEAVKQRAWGASVSTDWWAYKFEAADATPFNGSILHKVGVRVSFNSDSAELARRLNTEAAKAVKYGGVRPEDAMTFVTLGPAFQLGLENRMGSLSQDKDADLVIWSANPLSVYARCEATYIDGRCYFSLEQDSELQASAAEQRQRLVQKILRSKPDSPAGDNAAAAQEDVR